MSQFSLFDSNRWRDSITKKNILTLTKYEKYVSRNKTEQNKYNLKSHGSHQSWKVLESPGIWKESWKCLEFCWDFGKVLDFFLWSNSPKERFLSKHHHFLGFLCMLNLAVHWLAAMIFIWVILDAIMSIYSQHITGWQYSNLRLRSYTWTAELHV